MLPVDRGQLEDPQRRVVPHLGVEEPDRGVVVVEVRPLVAITRHRRELVRVTEQHDLHATEWLVLALPGLPQTAVSSAFTIDTSSITRVSVAFSSLRSSADCSISLPAMTPIGSRNSE
jgi:hypothetical protein